MPELDDMSLLTFGSLPFDTDLIVFDKDGTLIEFDFMWGRLAVSWVERLTADADDEGLREELYRSLGYDPYRRRTLPQGPLVTAPEDQLQTIVASVLYRHGMPWSEAQSRAQSALGEAIAALPLADLIRPAGDVAGLLARLQDVGIRVAVVTTDYRAQTEETLRILGVAHLVDHLVCGDDGLPWKPAPEMLQAACERLGAEPARTAVVGDTVADLLMARQAGAGLKVAVLSGAGDPTLLRVHADVVLRSIDEIRIQSAKGEPGR